MYYILLILSCSILFHCVDPTLRSAFFVVCVQRHLIFSRRPEILHICMVFRVHLCRVLSLQYIQTRLAMLSLSTNGVRVSVVIVPEMCCSWL
jgi:hypothetical protein